MNLLMCSNKSCLIDNRFSPSHTGDYCDCREGYLRPYDHTEHPLEPRIYYPTSIHKHLPKLAILPPVTYDITIIKGKKAYRDISRLSKQFNDITDKNFIKNINQTLSENKDVYIGYIPAPPTSVSFSNELISRVSGYEDEWFQTVIETTRIHYAMYDKNTHCFLFWAPTHKQLVKALSATRWRVIAFLNDIRGRNAPLIELYADQQEEADNEEDSEFYEDKAEFNEESSEYKTQPDYDYEPDPDYPQDPPEFPQPPPASNKLESFIYNVFCDSSFPNRFGLCFLIYTIRSAPRYSSTI